MQRHKLAPWTLIVASAVTLLTIIGATAANGVLKPRRRSHSFAPGSPLILASAVTLLTVIGAAATIGVLMAPGDFNPAGFETSSAVLERTAPPTSSPQPTPFVIKVQISGEAPTGSDQTLSPTSTRTPDPTPAPDPTGQPVTQAPARVPAAVYVEPTPAPPPAPTPVPGAFRPDLSDQLYGLLNNIRTSSGLQAVSPSDSLIARRSSTRSTSSSTATLISSTTGWSAVPATRAWARGYCCAVGEILVESEGSAQSMVDLWMSSAPHRSIILDPEYKSIGIACYGGPYVGDDGISHNPVVCSAEFGSG